MVITIVLGTRPEVIKLAPVILEGRRRGHTVKVVLTGQHRHMALPLLHFFGITPDVDLDVMVPGQTLTGLSGRVLAKLDAEKDAVSGDVILVQGDTTSAFIAAYWAFCNKIPVGHVEAGLRTYDLMAPFPEEANRQLIGRLAAFHFAPTKTALIALRKEGVGPSKIHNVGNTAIDALLYTMKRLKEASGVGIADSEKLSQQVREFIGENPLVLVTAHRRESFGEGFEGICSGIKQVAEARPDVKFVYPVHPNPNVRGPVERLLAGYSNILLCDPVPYVGFVELMQRASVLLTDSGGIQEEGPTLRKPIIVMREETERPEGVTVGFAKLVGTDSGKIRRETLKALKNGCKGRGKNPYGDGKSAGRIIGVLGRHAVKN